MSVRALMLAPWPRCFASSPSKISSSTITLTRPNAVSDCFHPRLRLTIRDGVGYRTGTDRGKVRIHGLAVVAVEPGNNRASVSDAFLSVCCPWGPRDARCVVLRISAVSIVHSECRRQTYAMGCLADAEAIQLGCTLKLAVRPRSSHPVTGVYISCNCSKMSCSHVRFSAPTTRRLI